MTSRNQNKARTALNKIDAMKSKEEELNTRICELETSISSLRESLANEVSEKIYVLESHKTEEESRMAAEKNQEFLKELLGKAEHNVSEVNERGFWSSHISRLLRENRRLKDLCSYQSTFISVVRRAWDAVNQKLEMADLSLSEIRTEYEEQKRIVSELQERLRDSETQLLEGESLRKKLHNTIVKNDAQLMKSKEEELNTRICELETSISSLRDSLANEVSEKIYVLESHKTEEEARMAAEELLGKAGQKVSEANERGFWPSHILRLLQENSRLKSLCSYQSTDLLVWRRGCDAVNQKLEMADLSLSEIRTECEEQKRIVSELQERLRDSETQLLGGERLRKKHQW